MLRKSGYRGNAICLLNPISAQYTSALRCCSNQRTTNQVVVVFVEYIVQIEGAK